MLKHAILLWPTNHSNVYFEIHVVYIEKGWHRRSRSISHGMFYQRTVSTLVLPRRRVAPPTFRKLQSIIPPFLTITNLIWSWRQDRRVSATFLESKKLLDIAQDTSPCLPTLGKPSQRQTLLTRPGSLDPSMPSQKTCIGRLSSIGTEGTYCPLHRLVHKNEQTRVPRRFLAVCNLVYCRNSV